jgi:putative ABC transport system substrate-binding protein
MRVSRQLFLGVCALALFLRAAPVAAEGPTIVVIKTKNALMYVKVVAGAKKVLAANARIVELNMDGRPEEEILQQVQEAAPTAVLAVGLPAARIAKRAATTAPIVYSLVASPKNAGLDGSAGVSFAPDPKRYVDLLLAAIPQAKKLGVVYQPDNASDYIAQLKLACDRAKIQLLTRTAATDRDIPASVRDLVDHVDAFLVLPDAQLITTESYRFIVQTTMDKRVPLITFSPELLSVGAMLALSPDLSDSGEKAGELLLQLLAGKPAPTLTVAMPEGIVDFNEKSAELLGRSIPPALLEKKGKRF